MDPSIPPYFNIGLLEPSRFTPDYASDPVRIFAAHDEHGHRWVLEPGFDEDRFALMSVIPPHPSVAPWFVDQHNGELVLVHEFPSEIGPSTDLSDVAHAIGGLLDGLAWLHEHGFAHGAISWVTLVDGRTGQLSLAGACGATIHAAPEDDVYSVAALAYRMVAGHGFTRGSPSLARLRGDVPSTISAAIDRALDPDPAQRPSAADLALMVRGELSPPLPSGGETRPFRSWWRGGVTSKVGGVVAALLVVCGAIVAGKEIDRNRRETVQVVTPPVSTEVVDEPATTQSTTTTTTPTTTTPTTTIAPTVPVTVAPQSSSPPTTSTAPVTMTVVSVPLPPPTTAIARG